MKNGRRLLTSALLILCPLLCFPQDYEDSVDDIFNDAGDTEISEEQSQSPQTLEPSFSTGSPAISFYGHFNASVGLVEKLVPDRNMNAGLLFNNTFGFTASPSPEFTIKGAVYTAFPDFKIDLSHLYADYILAGKVYLSIGATARAWGNSRIFDTNILDDEDYSEPKIFDPSYVPTRRFDTGITIPIGHGQIEALAMYNGSDIPEVSRENLSYAASIEYPIGPFAVSLFARTWAKRDVQRMQPAFGMSVATDFFGNHITLWGKVHAPRGNVQESISYAKFVGGLSRMWDFDSIGKMGFAAEYQFIYDAHSDGKATTTSELAFTAAWSHMFRSDFSPSIQWYINLENMSGYVIPSLSYTPYKYLNITLVAPILFNGGSYSYDSITYTSSQNSVTALLGILLTLSVDY